MILKFIFNIEVILLLNVGRGIDRCQCHRWLACTICLFMYHVTALKRQSCDLYNKVISHFLSTVQYIACARQFSLSSDSSS